MLAVLGWLKKFGTFSLVHISSFLYKFQYLPNFFIIQLVNSEVNAKFINIEQNGPKHKNRLILTSQKRSVFKSIYSFISEINFLLWKSTLLSNKFKIHAKLWKFIINWYNVCKFMTISPNNKLLQFCFYKDIYKSKISQNDWLL